MEEINVQQKNEERAKVFDTDMHYWLERFCEENDIDNIKKESQQVWNSALYYIQKHVFYNRDVLKSGRGYYTNTDDSTCTSDTYNYELVNNILDIYIYDMCMKYDKEVSILGFSTLTGIPRSLLMYWDGHNTVSTLPLDIYEKLSTFREESLANKLINNKGNPVGLLAPLNRFYGWNLPGVSRDRTSQTTLSAAELPRLSSEQPSGGTLRIDAAQNEETMT